MLFLLNRHNRLLIIILHLLFLLFLLGGGIRDVFVFVIVKLALL